ncbi:MAG: MBL fold metallo-hydrolase [Acidobacteria bacterium]|nr:MBL fold metallo-hydrolase [Acidobacteriota bacterium]MCA1650740.1 MBL fold metallo-hydrolase [Acidobacteriota bacterium]
MKLTFLGAARTVTGSKYLLDTGRSKVLFDAGLFQGLKELRERNWQDFPIKPDEIDAIVLTHAHLDHCGYLPKLVAAGFRGRVFCTAGTQDLCKIVLPDSGRIQEEDAANANRHGYSKHKPALPLYGEQDAFRALTLLQPVGYERPMPVADGVEVDFVNAGHLLGSAYARVRAGGRTILFGGDLGRFGRPVLPDPTMMAEADYLLVESTYGNRVHEQDDDGAELAEVIEATALRGGRLIIPAFAIGRVEEVLYWVKRLEEAKRIPVLPVFVDSPMAVDALARYTERLNELDAEMQPEHRDDKAPHDEAAHEPTTVRQVHVQQERQVCAFCTERFQTISSSADSKQLTASKMPAIIISSSGMATGGRVLHHLKAGLPDKRNTVLLVGYQAAGTRGRLLADGAPAVKIHGQTIPVHARVASIGSMSAHADSNEILRWLGGFDRPPDLTFLVHGEPPAMEALNAFIGAKLGWSCKMPDHRETVEIV